MALLSTNIFEALGLDWKSILFYLVNLVILVGVMVLLLYKPVKKMLNAKRQSLNETYEENARLKSESEKLKAEYEEKNEKLKTESARLSAEAAEKAQQQANVIIEQAQQQAKSIVDSAKKDATYQKEQLKNEYRDSVNTLAVQVAQKLLEREISNEDNSALIEQVLSDWEDGD